VLALLAPTSAMALTYSLASGNESWPADKRAAIIAAMDEAVAIYNANGYFDKTLWANYNAGVLTAQASYSGWIDFGGSIGTRVAMHEISHTLGVGQVAAWNTDQSGGKWTGSYALARVKLYDGADATIGCDTMHFWPYGLNYPSEDGTTARIRHVRMVSAMRRDMGIVADSDADGLPDDWEMFNFGNLAQAAAGDADGDGVSNLDEYNADTDPSSSLVFTWSGTTGSDWLTASNWSSLPVPTATVAPAGGKYFHRLNVNNNSGSALVYDGSLGATVYANPGGRGLVIGSGSNSANTTGTMTITGGSFSTAGSISPDVVGNNLGNTGTLTIAGGNFTSDALTLGVTGNGTGMLTVDSGTATIAALSYNFGAGGSGTVNLNGGTLKVDAVTEITTTGNHVFYFNGGTLTATGNSTAFLQGLTNAYVKSGGALIDTAGFDITVAQNLRSDAASPGGGLTKSGGGTLTLTGINSYTGNTTVAAGVLVVSKASAVLGDTSSGTAVSSGATLALSGGISYSAGEVVTIAGAGDGSRGALQSADGANIWNGPVVIAAATGTRIGVQDNSTLSLTGNITEAAPGSTVIFRAGTTPGSDIILGGSGNFWTGNSSVFSTSASAGVVKLGRANALPPAALLLVAGNGVAGRLDLNGFDQTVAGLAHSTGGSSAIGEAIITNSSTTPSTLTLAPAGTQTFNGTIQDGAGRIHLVKSGAGTQILNGNNTYSGNTTVDAGTLKLAQPALADSSAVAIASGARLNLAFTGNDTVAALVLGGTAAGSGILNATTHPAYFAGTGSLRVVGPDPFANWIGDSYPGVADPSVAGPAADPDGDGIANLLEYAAGSSPSEPSAALGDLTGNGGVLEFTYRKSQSATGITMEVEWSDSLAPGSWSTSGVTQTVLTPASDPQTITAIVPAGNSGKRFVRLRVTKS